MLVFKVKKKKIKVKISFCKLKMYYKHLLNIFYVLNKKYYFSFFLFNILNNEKLFLDFNETSIYYTHTYKLQHCKINFKVFNYLLKNKFLNLYKLYNYNILFNFNYILQINENFFFDKFYILKIKNLNTNLLNCVYIKLINYRKLISIDFFFKFLEKFNIYETHVKLIKLFIVYILQIIKILFMSILKKKKILEKF